MGSSSEKEILVIGSYNVDLSILTSSLPRPGQTVGGSDFTKGIGGKGANQAIAAARLGGKVSMVGCLGKDSFGEEAIDRLNKEGIDTAYMRFDEESQTGTALIMVEEGTGENQIVVAPGANNRLTPEHIEQIQDLDRYGIVVLQLEIPLDTVKRAAKLCHERGLKVILNPAPASEHIKDILGMVDIITPNETETELLTGIKIESEEDLKRAAIILLELGVITVLITLGSKGVYAISREEKKLSGGVIIPSIKVKAMDTTGAGDCFNGALAASLLKNGNLIEAIQFAAKAAAMSVTKKGAGDSMPYREEIEQF